MQYKYIRPWNCGLASSDKGIAKRLSDLLNAMDALNPMLIERDTPGMADKESYRDKLVKGLEADGWRFSRRQTNRGERIVVLPPKG